jgi:hypothetical protein
MPRWQKNGRKRTLKATSNTFTSEETRNSKSSPTSARPQTSSPLPLTAGGLAARFVQVACEGPVRRPSYQKLLRRKISQALTPVPIIASNGPAAIAIDRALTMVAAKNTAITMANDQATAKRL